MTCGPLDDEAAWLADLLVVNGNVAIVTLGNNKGITKEKSGNLNGHEEEHQHEGPFGKWEEDE